MSALRAAQHRCADERRRELVRASTDLNGIDALEVAESQTTLRVQFLHPLPGSGPGAVPQGTGPLDVTNVVVVGGRRVRDIDVVHVETNGDVLVVTVDQPGDFSPYELRLIDPLADDDVPAGFDTQLARVVFSFKAACESDLDCIPAPCPTPEPAQSPGIDYLAKDYESFRRLMLDRMAGAMAGFREPNPADIQLMLVELLAYVADHLSYYQDAVATEAYLGTARRRVSVRRHARMLDYRVHDGCSARTFLHFTATTGLTVPAGHPVATGGPDAGDDAIVFETLHALQVRAAHNALAFHTWGDERCCLPAGATRASLVRPDGVALAVGDFLLLEETEHPTQPNGQPDPRHRHVVRLTEITETRDRLDGTPVLDVTWAAPDALPTPLCLSAEGRVTAVARGNVALADHGETRRALRLVRERPEPPGPWRPLVPVSPLAVAVPFEADLPARRQLDVDPRQAVAALRLTSPDDSEDWEPVADLVAAAPTATAFVVEAEDDGTVRVRFGDDVAGRRPPRGTAFEVSARVGGGRAGNVAADALNRMIVALDGVASVRNPLAAVGGTDPEPTELVRQIAPERYRAQERAVTESDYATVTDRLPSVQRSSAELRWTGSWYTAFVTVDRVGGGSPDDDGLAGEIEAFLDSYRMAGVDVEIDAPVPVPLEIALDVCVSPGHLAEHVEAAVLDALSAGPRSDGSPGFFHPDRFTFGQSLHLSQLYAAVLRVVGVAWVRATTFRRFGRPDGGELDAGVVRVRGREILQLNADPSLPDLGRLTVTTVGGS